MVGVAAAVVAHGGAQRLGQFLDTGDEGFDRRVRMRRVFQRRIQVVHVGLVVLAVVDLHRLRVDVGFERVEGIGQGWQGVRHGSEAPCWKRALCVVLVLRTQALK
ncbi:hypothetical protein D9M68_703840 [compost metagenome]